MNKSASPLRGLLVLACACLVWFSSAAQAQPSNAQFSNRIDITKPGSEIATARGSNRGSTATTLPTYFPINRVVWYEWTATTYGNVTFRVDANFDADAYVFTSTSANPTESQLSPRGYFYTYIPNGLARSFFRTYASSNTPPGTKFYIVVGTWTASPYSVLEGDFELQISTALTELPDNIANALAVTGSSFSIRGLNASATQEIGEPLHANSIGSTKSVWLQWTAPSRSFVQLESLKSTFDAVFGVYTSPTPTTPVVTTLQTVSTNRGTFTAAAGQTYFIAIAGRNGTSGTIDGRFKAEPLPPGFPSDPGPVFAQVGTPVSSISYPASGSGFILYQWQRKAAGSADWLTLSNNATYGGATTSTLLVRNATLAMSGDQFRVLATDTNGTSTSRPINFVVTELAPTSTQLNQDTLIDLTNNTPPPAGTTYGSGKLPAGLRLNAATGRITGVVSAKPGNYPVTYWTVANGARSASKTVLVVVLPFPEPLAASYEALLEQSGGAGLPAGKLELKFDSAGAYTGRLLTADGKSRSLRGTVVLNASGTHAGAVVQVKGLGTLTFSVNNTPNAIIQRLTATLVTSGGTVSSNGGVRVANNALINSAVTLTLANRVNLDAVQPTRLIPAGVSIATGNISPSGVMTLRGKLADGTTFTTALNAGQDIGVHGVISTYRIYVTPYKKIPGAYLGGNLDITAGTRTYGIVNGQDVYWNLPAGARGSAYSAGFGPLGLNANLSSWSTPAPNNPLGTVLNLGQQPTSYTFTLQQGSGFNLSQMLIFGPDNNVIGLTNGATFNFEPATGLISGTYKLPGSPSRTATYAGVFLAKDDPQDSRPIFQGYVLLPDSTTRLPLSGSFTATPNP